LSLCNGIRLNRSYRYSFICQGTSTRRQRRDFWVLGWSCHLLLPV